MRAGRQGCWLPRLLFFSFYSLPPIVRQRALAEAAGGAHLGDEMTEFTDTATRLSRYLHCIQLAAAYSQVD